MKIVIADASLIVHRPAFELGLAPGTAISWHRSWDDPGVLSALRDADVFVGPRLTKAMGAGANRLRLIHTAGAGFDGIEPEALNTEAVCANTFHHEGSIAEYVATVLVALRRDLIAQDAALRKGKWHSSVYRRGLPQPKTLRGAVVTFLGFGHIGAASWKLLQSFGAEGIAVTRTGSVAAKAHGLRGAGSNEDLLTALSDSDALVISTPLTPETAGIIGATQLDALGPEGLLVNVARGPVVQEKALYSALKHHRIAGAAIDVWYRYPGPGGVGKSSTLPFESLDNVIMTPHSSAVTEETFRGRSQEIIENINRLAAGQPVRNVEMTGPSCSAAEPAS
ncbi:2-hydroxyacid dehydrogenase [Paenarthrobacter sp. PAE-2]|uniref:2-hydroxyacid dehydrogenase n=1 Tax=Paenarthrobacter sp. PAE-2 TaxID=2982532 RepID=UPI00222E8C4B|nr:2-hydroxyacid dehydrogenase [Paenarthrobacter sp. PAE-2]MCW3768879.1 2-hydroxyacid dehydrogenase [Paenarthrobacter sp. PAE-2]